MNSWLSAKEVRDLGIDAGPNVLVSRKASFYGAERIRLGDSTRIDDFCVLSAGRSGITIGRNVHIAVFCSLIGEALIEIADFAGISSRVSIYSSNEDYSGDWMTNPTLPSEYRRVQSAPVHIGEQAIVGSGSIVLPGARVGDGTAVGALSLVRGSLSEFSVYVGIPAIRIKARSRRMVELVESLKKAEKQAI